MKILNTILYILMLSDHHNSENVNEEGTREKNQAHGCIYANSVLGLFIRACIVYVQRCCYIAVHNGIFTKSCFCLVQYHYNSVMYT